MADVNFIQYGVNALRTQTSAGDLLSFGATNGQILGTILVVVFVFILVLFLIVLFTKKGKNLVSTLIK